MRMLPLLFLSLITTATGFSQPPTAIPIAPVPPDPLELVTGPTQIPVTAEERAALVSLLLNASEHYALHVRGGPAHILQISFNATASTLYPGGAGQLRETWISGQNWRWDGNMGSYSLVRISSNGAVYDSNQNSMLPMHFKLLTDAVFAPIEGAPRQQTLRTASVAWKGSQITCILESGQGNAQVGATGRQWDEREYCIDPGSGLLNISSIAPGIYAVYDYSNALKFHGRVLPGRVTISENGNNVVDAQLTSIADTDAANTIPFTPTAQMISQGPAIRLGLPFGFTLRAPGSAPGNMIQPVVVHSIIDGTGKVQESEALQTSSLTTAALDFVAKMTFGEMKPASGASSIERDQFLEVQFRPLP
jgi:hypothetical protein